MKKAWAGRGLPLSIIAAMIIGMLLILTISAFAAPPKATDLKIAQDTGVNIVPLSKPAVRTGVANQLAGSIRITEEETAAIPATNLWLRILPNELGVQDIFFSTPATATVMKGDIGIGTIETTDTGSLLRIQVTTESATAASEILISNIRYTVLPGATENGVFVQVLVGEDTPTATLLGTVMNAIAVDELPAPFPDVPPTHFASVAIAILVDLEVIHGYPDGNFRPGMNITRAEFAKMAVEAAGLPLIDTDTSSFNDVPDDHWALQYIETAREAGFILGYPDGSFRPNRNISRAEIAAIVVRAAGFPENLICTRFPDVPEEHWAFAEVMTARNNGIIQGFPDGTFRPNNPATRAEAAVMIFNWLTQE